jgi:hypothetical protein
MKPKGGKVMKRLIGLVFAAGALITLGGCVYGPGYYQRPGVVYDDGNGNGTVVGGAAVGYDNDYYYAPGYAYGGYYSPWYGYGFAPFIGLGFYGSYYGYHGYHGHGYGGSHGGWHGGNSHGSSGGSHGGSWHGGH